MYKLNELQEIELDILKKFVEICEKYDLIYFLDAGTLLGAVRHGGFIPWDDDIDVSMPRSDYKKFLEIAKKELGEEYFLQNRNTDKNYPFNFSKLRKNNTSFVEWGLRNVDMHHGIYIDIFPYDLLPQKNRDKFIYESIELDKKFLRKLVPDLTREKENNFKGFIKNLKKKVIFYLYKLYPINKLDEKVEEQFEKYNQLDYEDKAYTCLAFRDKYIFEEAVLFPTGKITFEDIEVNCPNDTHKFLEYLYGDYMQLPPENERDGHSPYLIDFNKSYRK